MFELKRLLFHSGLCVHSFELAIFFYVYWIVKSLMNEYFHSFLLNNIIDCNRSTERKSKKIMRKYIKTTHLFLFQGQIYAILKKIKLEIMFFINFNKMQFSVLIIIIRQLTSSSSLLTFAIHAFYFIIRHTWNDANRFALICPNFLQIFVQNLNKIENKKIPLFGGLPRILLKCKNWWAVFMKELCSVKKPIERC